MLSIQSWLRDAYAFACYHRSIHMPLSQTSLSFVLYLCSSLVHVQPAKPFITTAGPTPDINLGYGFLYTKCVSALTKLYPSGSCWKFYWLYPYSTEGFKVSTCSGFSSSATHIPHPKSEGPTISLLVSWCWHVKFVSAENPSCFNT